MKRAFLEPHDFDEDAMPTPCMICGGIFDLDDGATNPRKENEIICEGCADDIEKEIEKEEEIEECLSLIEDAKITIKDNNQRLHELGYRYPLPMKTPCAKCGGNGWYEYGYSSIEKTRVTCECQTALPMSQ